MGEGSEGWTDAARAAAAAARKLKPKAPPNPKAVEPRGQPTVKVAPLHEAHYGDFDSQEVHLTPKGLHYHSYEEGHSEGYHFHMKRQGDQYVLHHDDSSTPVPGSHILWMHAHNVSSWGDPKAIKSGPKGSGRGDVKIPASKMHDAVKNMAAEERGGLDLAH